MELPLKILLAYLLGSIVGSLVVGRLWGGVDIRKLGSGNAGGTNALRTQGPAFAIWVILIDIAKGWIAAAVLPGLGLPGVHAGAGSPGDVAARGYAPSPPSSATYFRCGMAFAAARAWPRSSARSPASSSCCCCRCSRAGWRWSMVSGFVGLASIIAALRHSRLSTDA